MVNHPKQGTEDKRGEEESTDGVEWVEKSIRVGFGTEGQKK